MISLGPSPNSALPVCGAGAAAMDSSIKSARETRQTLVVRDIASIG
jgi:hypothetical protein